MALASASCSAGSCSAVNSVSDDPGPQYALGSLKQIRSAVAGKRWAVFLDYDGTLTPIVSHPKDATLSSDVRDVLRALSSSCVVALVTGRDMATITDFVGLDTLYYAASHGFDIRGPKGVLLKQVAVNNLSHLELAYKHLAARESSFRGLLVEKTKYSVAIHYRNMEPKDVPQLEKLVDAQVSLYPHSLVKTYGKMVFELRPRVEWHKGKAVEFLLASIFGDDKSSAYPIYIGDDRTDEDAFNFIRKLGYGLSIHVRQANVAHMKTAAAYYLNSTDEVHSFLKMLCGIKHDNADAQQQNRRT